MMQDSNILVSGFLDSAKATPEAIAIEVGDVGYSYQELKENALRITNILKNQSDNQFVAVLAAKSFVACSAILGVLLAGKAYLPLNKKNPPSRTLGILEFASTNVLVAGKECLEYLREILSETSQKFTIVLPDVSSSSKLNEEIPNQHFIFSEEIDKAFVDEVSIKTEKDSVAYLLFTSGSTGSPKGVLVKNQSAADYVNYITSKFDFSASDRFSQTFDLTFDLSVHDLFVCWKMGACLCFPEENSTPVSLANYIKEKRITVWFSVPSVALLFMKTRLLKEGHFPFLRYSLFCGEALTEEVAEKWSNAAPDSRLINLYGPTEATIAIALYEWKKEPEQNNCLHGIVPIGKVFGNQDFCILDHNNQIVEVGESGELLLSGSQIFEGYLHNPEISKKVFTSLNGKNWYKTGDLVMEDNQKNLHFLGRVDSQVKINGFRVELHEIDQIIRKATKSESLATVFDQQTNTLATFIEKEENDQSLEEIYAFCVKHLPAYMIPSKIIYIDKIPFNANGKIDRKYLSTLLHE